MTAAVVWALGWLLSPAHPGTARALSTPAPPPPGVPALAPRERPPGPAVLYAPLHLPPIVRNDDGGPFSAPPLMVSGHEAYFDGEYSYWDHLYDDYGADTDGATASAFSERAGDIDPPSDPARYGGNAADLVEVRIRPTPEVVWYRFTLNTLLVPDAAVVALAWDTDGDVGTGSADLPGDPGVPVPGTDEVITVWGTGGTHVKFGPHGEVTTPLSPEVDLEANRITVAVPRAVSDPSGVWRATLLAGVHDPDSHGWATPGMSATATRPGGATPTTPSPPAVLNVGFRFGEPYVGANVPPDVAQAEALAAGDISAFAAEIDFDALEAGVRRTSVPPSGTTVRTFASRLDLGEGRDLGSFPQYRGTLQPFSVHVPPTGEGAGPPGLTLLLHSLGQHHWQYNGSEGVRQLGEGRGHVVATPLARGPDGWYQGPAELDVFEMWNHLAWTVPLDPERVAVAGYSMGGYGTYRLATLYPDLFGAAYTMVGPPGDGIWIPPGPPTGGIETLTNLWLENARNVPFMNMAAGADELVPLVGPRAQNLGAPEVGVVGFEQLGYRYRFVLFPAAEHFTLATLGYDFPPAATFLGDAVVERRPRRVTYSAVPATDDPRLGLFHDAAYWVADLRARSAEPVDGRPAEATVDLVSGAVAGSEPVPVRVTGSGTTPLPWTMTGLDWEAGAVTTPENRLVGTLTNVASVMVEVEGAGLSPERELTLELTSDGPAELLLAGLFADGSVLRRDGRVVGRVGPDPVLAVPAGSSVFTITPPEGSPPGGTVDTDGGPPGGGTLPATGGPDPLGAVVALGAAAWVARRAVARGRDPRRGARAGDTSR